MLQLLKTTHIINFRFSFGKRKKKSESVYNHEMHDRFSKRNTTREMVQHRGGTTAVLCSSQNRIAVTRDRFLPLSFRASTIDANYIKQKLRNDPGPYSLFFAKFRDRSRIMRVTRLKFAHTTDRTFYMTTNNVSVARAHSPAY